MIKDQQKWDKMISMTSALGGAKILAGVILLITIPDASACPEVSVGSLYMYPFICIFLGVTWIARGRRLQQLRAHQSSGLLPTHADAPVVQAHAVAEQPTK